MMNEVKNTTDCSDIPCLFCNTGVTFITGVPDSALGRLIMELEEAELNRGYILATREDNAIALAVGAYLAGEQPLVFMKSAGFGNAIDVLTSLAIVYGIPLVLLIGWAGYKGRDVPHHNIIGEPLLPLLDTLNMPSIEIGLTDSAEAIASAIREAITLANAIKRPVAVLGIPKELSEETHDDKR